MFPKSNCDICNKPIEGLQGWIAADNFKNSYLDRLLEEYEGDVDFLCKGPDREVVNAATRLYPLQFDLKLEHETGIIEVGGYMQERLKLMKDSAYRFNTIYPKIPDDKFLFMLVHDGCLRDDFPTPYYIDLDRIETPRKALDWSFHLVEKN